ncbi:thioredoxin [Platysternon megacephalum]|uniref:Thioredoxin n=1 Tax=Platysternon megacephalum TaxID=55544 RepID=A0A4D9DKQ8_9SAUR|nr:thioredoxin [Platysternon megacephalum]
MHRPPHHLLNPLRPASERAETPPAPSAGRGGHWHHWGAPNPPTPKGTGQHQETSQFLTFGPPSAHHILGPVLGPNPSGSGDPWLSCPQCLWGGADGGFSPQGLALGTKGEQHWEAWGCGGGGVTGLPDTPPFHYLQNRLQTPVEACHPEPPPGSSSGRWPGRRCSGACSTSCSAKLDGSPSSARSSEARPRPPTTRASVTTNLPWVTKTFSILHSPSPQETRRRRPGPSRPRRAASSTRKSERNDCDLLGTSGITAPPSPPPRGASAAPPPRNAALAGGQLRSHLPPAPLTPTPSPPCRVTAPGHECDTLPG